MAEVNIALPDDLVKQLKSLEGAIDEIIGKTLEAGAEVAEREMRDSLRAAVSVEHKDGELVNALGRSPVLKDKDGNQNVKIGFSEHRRDGRSNAVIANVLEHGGRAGKQKPRHWLKPIRKRVEADAMERMEQEFAKEVKRR